MRPAAQLLSASVATATGQFFPEKEAERDFVATVDAGFDVLNARAYSDPKPLRQGFPRHAGQYEALEQLELLVQHARFGKHKDLLPFQKGFLITIASMRLLADDVRRMFGADTYMLTGRVTQDPLESFFSQVRGKGGPNTHPDATEAKNRMRALTLQYLVRLGVGPTGPTADDGAEECRPAAPEANSTDAVIEELLDAADAAVTDADEDDVSSFLAQLDAAETPVPVPCPTDPATGVTSEDYGLAHCAGYVASKVGDPRLGLPSTLYGEELPVEAVMTRLLSAGGLTIPTPLFLAQYRAMEQTFCMRHYQEPDRLSRAPNVIIGMTRMLCERHPDVSRRVAKRFARLRTFKRMRDVNRGRRSENLARREARKRKEFAK